MVFNNNKMDEFLNKYIVSFIAWDIIVFFARNPGAFDTSEGIARRLGRKDEEVQKELKYLSKISFLTSRKTDEGEVYFLASNTENRKFLDDFLLKMDNRIFRLKLLSRLLKKRTQQEQNINSI